MGCICFELYGFLVNKTLLISLILPELVVILLLKVIIIYYTNLLQNKIIFLNTKNLLRKKKVKTENWNYPNYI